MRFALAIFVVVSASVPMLAIAQPMPSTRPAEDVQIRTWLTSLDDADPAAREAAYSSLLELRGHDLAPLKNAIEALRPLSPTQLAMLKEIVVNAYLRDEPYEADQNRGFLGISMPSQSSITIEREDLPENAEPAPNDAIAVPMGERIPGFCAFRAFRQGDILLSVTVEGEVHPLQRWEDVVNFVKARRAGDALIFAVLRGQRLLDVTLRLDPRPRAADLPDLSLQTMQQRLDAAERYWNAHFDRMVTAPVS